MDFDLSHEQIKLGDNLDLDRILEELDNISKRLSSNRSNHSLDFDADEEKLVQAVKLSIEQKMSSDNNCYSEEMIMDALQTLSLNKGLVLKLLQDPNSKLFQHVQDSEEARLGKEEPVNLKGDKLSRDNNKNLGKKMTKSVENYPVGENNKGCQSQSKIVILMPGPEESRSPETDILGNNNNNTKVQLNERSVYHFSFSGIKRKLKHVMGKERPPPIYPPKTQNSNFTSEKGESFGWRSPNRNHFYTEKFALSSPSFKKGEVVGKLKVESENPNIYIEARKHLSEMVKSGDENTVSSYRNSPVKPLGRILSLPEYIGSPCPSPRKPGDDAFLTAQMRLSPRGTVKADLIQRVQNSDSQPCTSGSETEDKVQSLDVNDNLLGDDKKYSSEIECFNEDAIVSEVQSEVVEIEQTNELSILEEANIIGGGTIKIDNEENASMGSILISSGEDQVLPSPVVPPPYDHKNIEIEDSNHAVDKIEQPSPISVLEPLLTDDDISPASTVSQPVKNEVQPRLIHFEEEQQSSNQDQGICTRISMEDEETAFEYVEAVLLGSDLNWNDFLQRWVCSSEILDQTLFEEVELFSSRPLHDQKLLFHSANEALKEISECYFGCFGIKNKADSVPKGMDLINDVWGRVECCLSQHLQSRSLDKLIRDDLVESKKWMNIRSDMEGIVFDMEESIFGELVEEIVLGFGGVDL